MEQRRKAVSTVRGLARTYLAVIKDKIQSFELTTLSDASVDDQTRSMDYHEIQCEKGHTNDPRTRRFLNTEKKSCHWVNKFSLAVQERMSTNLCSHG